MTKVAEIYQTPAGTLVIRPRPGLLLPFSDAAETRRQADQSWTIEPLGEWISVEQAARILGLHVTTVRRLRDRLGPDGRPVLLFRQPSPAHVQIHLGSLLAHLASSEDPEFWRRRALAAPLQRP